MLINGWFVGTIVVELEFPDFHSTIHGADAVVPTFDGGVELLGV